MIKLRENEEVRSINRRHRVVLYILLAPIKFVALLTVILAVASIFISSDTLPGWMIKAMPWLLDFNITFFLLFLFSLFLLILWTSFFMVIVNYYLDCWIVTNQRTIHTELRGFFNRIYSSIEHDKIQDISVDVKGILPTFFNYGDLHMQTAGAFREFIFFQIPEPHETKKIIHQAIKEYSRYKKDQYFAYKKELI